MSSKIGSILGKLNIFKSKDPQFEFLLGKDYLAQGNYKKALYHFKTAFQHYKDDHSRINALENAIIAATKLKDPQEAFNLSYQLSRLVAKTSRSDATRLLPYLERAWQAALLLKNDMLSSEKLGEVTLLTFLAYLAAMKFTDCQKVLEKSRTYLPSGDLYVSYMEKSIQMLFSEESLIEDWRLPSISAPKEFEALIERAEAVARAHSTLKINMDVQPESVFVNEEVKIIVTVKAFAPLTVIQLSLEHLPRGLRMSTSSIPPLPFRLVRGESLTIEYIVRAQLEGTWDLGPVSVKYKIIDESRSSDKKIGLEFIVRSNKKQLTVSGPHAQLEPNISISLQKELVDEDGERELHVFDVTCSIRNSGERVIENLLLSIEYPNDLELVEGTRIKRILELSGGEEYDFPLRLRPKDSLNLHALIGKELTFLAVSDDGSIQAQKVVKITEEHVQIPEEE